jgi:hypothetical protein
VNGTLVLSIGETVEEVQDTGFLSAAPTLAVQQIGSNALLQVHPQGIVLADRCVNEWRVPQGKTIITATTNKRQVVVALSSAELVYFELDLDGQLNEYQDRKAMGSTVLALSIAEVPEGRQRTPYLVCSLYVCFSYRANNVIGRRLQGPDCPYHFVGSRKHTRNYQSSSVNCSSFFHLYRLYVGRQYQQGSTNHVREHWFTKRCLASHSP